MPKRRSDYWPCIDILCETVNNAQQITYEDLSERLGYGLANTEWSSLLNLVAGKMKRELGDNYDLTWAIVYKSGPAKGLGRYFSNGGKAVGSSLLDPRNRQKVDEYKQTLQAIYAYKYELRKIDGADTLVKSPR